MIIIQDPSTTLRDPRRKCCDDMVVMDKCFRGRNQDSLYTNCTDNSWSERNLLEWFYVTNVFVKEIKAASARIALAIRGAKVSW